MKLRNLFEVEVTPAVFEKYLVVFVDDPSVRGSANTPGGFLYIISDIPPISPEQYNKLFRVSFEEGGLSSSVFVARFDLKDWYSDGNNAAANVTTYVYPWKEFVAHMKEKYPYDGDDFDE